MLCSHLWLCQKRASSDRCVSQQCGRAVQSGRCRSCQVRGLQSGLTVAGRRRSAKVLQTVGPTCGHPSFISVTMKSPVAHRPWWRARATARSLGGDRRAGRRRHPRKGPFRCPCSGSRPHEVRRQQSLLPLMMSSNTRKARHRVPPVRRLTTRPARPVHARWPGHQHRGDRRRCQPPEVGFLRLSLPPHWVGIGAEGC